MAKYLGTYGYKLNGQHKSGNPISAFSVVGGTLGNINLDSTSAANIELELQQAVTYQNITLFTPSTDMLVMADLMHLMVNSLVANRSDMELSLKIQRVSDDASGSLASFSMQAASALVQNVQLVANRELMIHLRIGDVKITHGWTHHHGHAYHRGHYWDHYGDYYGGRYNSYYGGYYNGRYGIYRGGSYGGGYGNYYGGHYGGYRRR